MVSTLEAICEQGLQCTSQTLPYNTPLRSQSRQLPDVISIEISQPDLLSTEITFQIPNYFQITFKIIWNYLVQKIPLPALPRSRFVIERLAVEPNLLIWFKKYRSPLSTLSPSPAGQWWIWELWQNMTISMTMTTLWWWQDFDDDGVVVVIQMQKVKCSSSAHQLLGDKVAFMIRWYLGFQRSVLGFKKKEIHQNLILEMMGQ